MGPGYWNVMHKVTEQKQEKPTYNVDSGTYGVYEY